MQDLLTDHPDLAELARQAALQEYGLPFTGDRDEAAPELSTPPELVSLVRLAVRVTGMTAGAINIITADQQHSVAAFGVDVTVCSREDSMCSKVFRSGAMTVITDTVSDDRFAANPFVNGTMGRIRSYASVPLVSPGGHALGSLCVFSENNVDFGPAQREGLEILASQVIEVLELQLKTRQLAAALDAVRRSNEDLAGFAARVSHDLRNPLTAILGYTELTEEDPTVSGAAARYFRIIRGSASRMLSTVEEVLEFSRIGGTLNRETGSLTAAVEAVRQDILPLTREYEARITVVDAELAVDHSQLRALLQNLISNAVKYSRPGTAPVIEVLADLGETQQVRVIDHGKGIAAEDRARVLEPLVRLHRNGDPAGTGIGLATCARIASAHGGTISITETPGGGTTVTVDLGART
jgi:signal transduction histidine kinase